MASFPLRKSIVLAAQLGSLDCLADGRTVLMGCIGGGHRADASLAAALEYSKTRRDATSG